MTSFKLEHLNLLCTVNNTLFNLTLQNNKSSPLPLLLWRISTVVPVYIKTMSIDTYKTNWTIVGQPSHFQKPLVFAQTTLL
jgi:hypothetical protein